jgi:hypothetical protein
LVRACGSLRVSDAPRLTQSRSSPYPRPQCLKRPGGVAYIAAKSHYFGVGGGVPEFLALVAADSALTAERVEAIEDGVSTRREILRLAWRAGGV